MDGGAAWGTNLASAVDRCRETVDRDEDITMDIIICSDGRLQAINETGNTISNYLRYWSMSSFSQALSDVSEFKRAFPNVNYRHFFMASKPLASAMNQLEFSYEVLEPMIQIGMDDAARVIGTTKPGETFARFDKWVQN